MLFYQTLSRKLPYYQYPAFGIAHYAIMKRGEFPKRPGVKDVRIKEDSDEEEDVYADDPEEGCERIDEQTWAIIVQCFAPKPEDRPDIARVRELIVDLDIHDEREAPRVGTREEVEVKNLHRVEELLAVIEVCSPSLCVH